jgi:hypothetical protein
MKSDLKEKIKARILYHITSKKFWAWCGATLLRVIGKIDIAAWVIVTCIYTGVEAGQNIAEIIKKGAGKE